MSAVPLIIWTCLLLLVACDRTATKQSDFQNPPTSLTTDTIAIGRRVVTDEIPGASYRKRAMGYYKVEERDTSDVLAIFSEAKEDGQVNMYFRSEDRTTSYRERLNDLKFLLPEAAKDFNLDSLRSIFIGRLVDNGDVAVDVTNEFRDRYGDRPLTNGELSVFMKDSKLARDFNEIFKPYSLFVASVSVEKSFYSTRAQLYAGSRIESDSTMVPEKIIDCIAWLSMDQIE